MNKADFQQGSSRYYSYRLMVMAEMAAAAAAIRAAAMAVRGTGLVGLREKSQVEGAVGRFLS